MTAIRGGTLVPAARRAHTDQAAAALQPKGLGLRGPPAAPASGGTHSLGHLVHYLIHGKPGGGTLLDAKTGKRLPVHAGVVLPAGVGAPLLKIGLLGYSAKPLKGAAGNIPGIGGRLAKEAIDAATGFPAGAYQLASNTGPTVHAIKRQYAQTYGPLAHGHVGAFLHGVSQRPLGPVLDLATLGFLGASALERAGITHVPTERSVRLPGTEGHVQPAASPNPVTRAVEHRIDRFSERHPQTPIVGAEARIARRIPFEAERSFERQTARAIPFMVAERGLGRVPNPRGKALRVAYDVLHSYGHVEPGKALGLLDKEIGFRQARVATDHGEEIAHLADQLKSDSLPHAQAVAATERLKELQAAQPSLLEKAHQFKTIALLKAARPYVERYDREILGGAGASRATRRLQVALHEGTGLAAEGQRLREEMGQITPEAAAERVHQRARLVTGATFREGRLSKTLVQARRDVESLHGRVEKIAARRDVNARKLLVREQGKALRAVTGKDVPHDIGSAQQELGRLERFHEQQIDKLIAARVGKFSDPESRRETMLRNQMRSRKGRSQKGQEPDLLAPQRGRMEVDPKYAEEILAGEQRSVEASGGLGGVHVPTLKEEARAHVEEELEQAIARNPDHPAVQRIAQRIERINQLREGIPKAQDIQHGFGKGREINVGGRVIELRGLEPRLERRAVALEDKLIAEDFIAPHQRGQMIPPELDEGGGRGYLPDEAEELNRIYEKLDALYARADARGAGTSAGRPLTHAERLELLGRREEGGVPKDLADLRAALHQAQEAGDTAAEAKVHAALAQIGYHEPGIVGGNVLALGKVLRPTGTAALERVGGALSVAKDRVQRLEEQHVKRYGFLPEEKHVLELQGGEKAGASAAYVGDRANRGLRDFVGRARSVTGKRPKESYERQSRGILFSQGRATRTSRNVLHDFVQTAKSVAHRQDLEKAGEFAKPLNTSSPTLLDKGHTFYNPEGVKIPRRFTEEAPIHELEQMLPQDMQAAARSEYEALMQRVFPDPQSNIAASREFKQAVAEGRVKQIPVRVKQAFEGGTYVPSAGMTGVGKGVVSLLDLANNITRDGLLYLKASFAPLNFSGNVVFGAAQQGVWFPVNLAKAAGTLGGISHENLLWLDHEVGSGAALSLSENAQGPLGRTTRRIAHVQNVLADLLPRRAAIIHELAGRGFKTNEEITRLRLASQAGGKRSVRILNQAAEQAEKAMVQYRGMSPFERRVVARAVFIYPWLRGATRYLGRFPLDRPVAANVVANLGEQGNEKTLEQLGKLVSYLNGVVPVGPVHRALGTDLIPVRNPAAITPYQTGAQSLQILEGLVSRRDVPASYRVASLLQPSIAGLLSAGTHTNLQTGHGYPGDKGFLEILADNTVQQFAIENAIKAIGQKTQTRPFTGSPANQRLYEQKGGWGEALRVFFEGGFRKRELNLPAEQAKQHGEVRASMNAGERARDDIVTLTSDLVAAAAKTGIPIAKDGRLVHGVADAVAALGARKLNRLEYADKNGLHGKLTVRDELAADAQLLVKQGHLRSDQARNLLAWAAKQQGPDGEARVGRVLDELGAIYFHRGVLSLVQSALGHKGVRLKVPTP